MLKNFLKRSITFIFGISFVVLLVFYLPYHRFLAMGVFISLLCLLAEIEMSRMLHGKVKPISVLSSAIPAVSIYNPQYTEISVALLVVLALLTEIKRGEKDGFSSSNSSISKSIFTIAYPAYLASFTTRFISLENVDSYCIFLLLLAVFTNDTFAYIFGVLFGKNNKGIVKASPNKSVAGFVGGFVSCIAVTLLYSSICKRYLPSFSVPTLILIAAGTSILANIGDLTESVIKRSAGVKDSGTVVLGRGGVLDSLDSFLTTGILFYVIFKYLY